MKIAVRCADCSRQYLLDEAFADTVLPCPACGATRGLNGPPPTPPVEPPPRSDAAEVVCPRCHLHFVPRGGAPDAGAPERRTVLVVESMEYFRDIARDALAGRYEVKTAADLSSARQALAQGGIDLIVLARKLDGGESGIDLLRGLRAKPCPIVIFTDQDESEIYGTHWSQLRSLGADDLVVKGLNAGESLLRKARSLFGEQWDADE